MSALPNAMSPQRRWEGSLVWIQLSRFARDYELRDPNGTIKAKFSFKGLFTKDAIAEAGIRAWTFRTMGIWRPKVIALERGESKPSFQMTMAPLGWAGRGEIQQGQKQFSWNSKTLFHDRGWELTEPSGRVVLTCRKPWLRQPNDTNRFMCEIKLDSEMLDESILFLPLYMNG
ncbi:MAG: hypothetical protein ABL958_03805 [Bdellovibrionia bacterium]